MSQVRAFIGLGSNVDPERNLLAALHLLRARVCLVAVSTFYRTPALGRPQQSPFLNGVAELRTGRSPAEVKFRLLRRIEAELGRQRTGDKDAPRPIDLDLLVYDDLFWVSSGLTLPDPEIRTRAFLAHPLHELAPDLVLQDKGEPLAKIVARLSTKEMQPLPEYTQQVREALRLEP